VLRWFHIWLANNKIHKFGLDEWTRSVRTGANAKRSVQGPTEMLDALIEHWENNGDPDRLHFERFQPKIGGDADAGEGGEVCFLDSDKNVECDGGTSILEAGEKAGLNLAFGCRIGICHTCVGTLKSGKLRDLRSGDVIEPTGQDVRICINSAEGDVELEL
jgi:stearoyl-CoA 9-desaturase NADPH oxidoreductase